MLQRVTEGVDRGGCGVAIGMVGCAPFDGMSLNELNQRQKSLEELHANVSNHVRERITTMS